MENEMRKDIDRVKNFGRFINENIDNEVNLKKIIEDVFYDGLSSEQSGGILDVKPYSFEEYWIKNKDKLIQQLKSFFYTHYN